MSYSLVLNRFSSLIRIVMKQTLLYLCLSLFSFSSYASFSCDVDVSRVLIYQSGAVNVLHSGRSDYTYVCNLKGSWKGVDTVTCAMWASLLQSTQNNNKKATFYYNGDGSCSTLETYSRSPAPVYIGSID